MRVPSLGPHVPRRGNALTAALGRLVLRAMGWRIEGELPDLPKFVIIGAPHTSNWDFIVAMATMFALGLRASWLGKHTLFEGLFGWYFRWLGGIPVRRDRSEGVVEDTVEAFRSRESLVVGISPEGTRKAVSQWKRGFYHIASGAGVPILPVALDYSRKAIVFLPPFHPTPDAEADLGALQALYSPAMARHPDLF